MKSNTADKNLRDKLKGLDVPFDPQAWEQMEAMLDKKKKRRVIFWWWWGGIAAGLLLFALVGYEVGIGVGQQQLACTHTNAVVMSEETSNNIPQATNQPSPTGNTEHEIANTPSSNNKTTGTSAPAVNKTNEATPPISSAKPISSKRASKNGSTQHQSTAMAIINTSPNGISRHDKKKATQLAQSQSHSGSLAPATPHQKPLTDNENTALHEEVIAMNSMAADQLQGTDQDDEMYKREENALPKPRHIFQCSVGVMGTLTATTPGWKYYNHEVDVPQAGKPSFYHKPSYMVGLTADFTFLNRFAFTSGLMFAQTSFRLYAPYAQGFTNVPTDYTSHITEMAIPMGIKIYPVATKKFRFYVAAGFVHHIRINETFTYRAPAYVPANLQNTSFDNTTGFFPVKTDFAGGGYEVTQADANGTLTTSIKNTDDFSINAAVRYYTSFYTGLGVEGIIRHRWILFAEPTYRMTLQRIGYQERRKFDVGASAGFRYQF